MDKIQVLQPKFRTNEILHEIKECLDKGWSGMGYKTVEFEEAWSKYTGLKFSHFLSSNTVGLHLALRILGSENNWKSGDEIITTPLTFVSTNHAILYESYTPVFADVDDFLCLDPSSVLQNINEKTRAVIFVGMGVNPGQLDQISKICEDNGIKLILDAAHMSGTFVNSEKGEIHVGSEADVSVFSFQAVKNLPTADSGMICFKDKNRHILASKLSWLGIDKDTFSRTNEGKYKWKYDVPNIGFKYHGNSIMASIGKVQLKYLDEDNARRNEISSLYEECVSKLDRIFSIRDSDYCSRSAKHLYQILVPNVGGDSISSRDLLLNDFYEENIYPGVHYTDNTEYPMYSKSRGLCPKSHRISEELISLPLHLNMTDMDVNRVLKVLEDFR